MGFNKPNTEDARKSEAEKEAAARHWFLWVQRPACRTTNAIDLRTLDRHPDASITIPGLSCRSCRPNAPFAELLRLSRPSVLDECKVARGRAVLGQ